MRQIVSAAMGVPEPAPSNARVPVRAALRETLDRIIELAEDTADIAAVEAMNEDHAADIEPVPWEQVKAELGL
jgi:hypothetical protein